MPNVNAEWHEQNKMPRCPTVDQRIEWHLAHEKNCQCAPMPDKLKAVLAERSGGGAKAAAPAKKAAKKPAAKKPAKRAEARR